jgi:hypothetical protein
MARIGNLHLSICHSDGSARLVLAFQESFLFFEKIEAVFRLAGVAFNM